MVNIVDLKREIQSILGQKSNVYFSRLRDYLSGRIEKDQFMREAVYGVFPPDKIKVHDRFVGFIQGAHVESDPRLGEKYKEVKRRNELMKRRFDGTKVVYEWTPPIENGLSHSILLGTWAEGLEGVQPDVHQLLETALNTYLRRVIKNGVKESLANEPLLPSCAEHASCL